jgi:hypothetical protein
VPTRAQLQPERLHAKAAEQRRVHNPRGWPAKHRGRTGYCQVIADDRKRLSSFVEQLNMGIAVDDMDEELKSWWVQRY